MTSVPEEPKSETLIAERYRLLELVGAGGMGQVWRAHDEGLDRVVALKPAYGDEARKGARLQHPNVITLYDVVRHGGQDWLVMEYVAAPSLARLVAERGPLPPGRAARIGAQMAAGLAAIHAQGVVHCDVTPANVLITDDGVAKLIDFGISHADGDAPLPEGTRRAGTRGYMAPEVAAGRSPTPASDVSSLGATLYAAVTGAPPSDGGVPAALRGALAQVLSRLLAPRPADRPSMPRAGQLLLAAARGRTLMRRNQIIAVAAACLAVLVVLLPAASGDAVPPDRPAAAGALGDPRTADPCALVDPRPLRRFGPAQLATDYGNFGRCDVVIQSDSIDIDVTAEFDLSSAGLRASNHIRLVNGLRVVRDGCDRLVLLPHGYMLDVYVNQYDGKAADLCAMADVATRTATGVLSRDRLPRRPSPAPGSLRRLRACSLLDDQALTAVPGVDAASREAGFAGWQCLWRSDVNNRWVDVRFDHNDELGSEGRPIRIAGRRAVVLPRDWFDSDTCSIWLANRRVRDNHGDPTNELVMVTVGGSGPQQTRCRMAVDLARSAAGTLPVT